MASSMWLITYDISQPKRWRKVFRLLKSYGQSVQYSVFECRLNASQQQTLFHALQALICEDEDKISCYPVCGQCNRRAVLMGNAKRSEDIPLLWVFSDADI